MCLIDLPVCFPGILIGYDRGKGHPISQKMCLWSEKFSPCDTFHFRILIVVPYNTSVRSLYIVITKVGLLTTFKMSQLFAIIRCPHYIFHKFSPTNTPKFYHPSVFRKKFSCSSIFIPLRIHLHAPLLPVVYKLSIVNKFPSDSSHAHDFRLWTQGYVVKAILTPPNLLK